MSFTKGVLVNELISSIFVGKNEDLFQVFLKLTEKNDKLFFGDSDFAILEQQTLEQREKTSAEKSESDVEEEKSFWSRGRECWSWVQRSQK